MGTVISWTNETWNPVTGCSRVSDGCRNCYAERLSLKFGWSEKSWTARNAAENVVCHPERLVKPYKFKKPSRVFVNSMSDLFHEMVPSDFIARVFQTMVETPQHTYQILTKRPERAALWSGPWAENIWMGTSVEDSRVVNRVDLLRQCEARVRFLSCEPLIGPLPNLDLTGIHWVIVGGESGPGFRPMPHEWAREIRDLCAKNDVAFFFKQSAHYRTERGIALEEADGSRNIWRQFPGKLDPPVAVT
jgi:protein gp37